MKPYDPTQAPGYRAIRRAERVPERERENARKLREFLNESGVRHAEILHRRLKGEAS